MRTKARLLIGSVIALELVLLSYLVLMAWLFSAWFLDDAEAARMQPMDWWIAAGQRFVLSAIVGAFTAAMVYGAHRGLAALLHHPASRIPFRMALLFFGSTAGASLIGAIQFGITKPYM